MLIGYSKSELRVRMKAIRADFTRRYSSKFHALRKRLFEEQQTLCALGGKPIPAPDGFFADLDHRLSISTYANMPLSLERACQLANTEANIQLVCKGCNSKKNAVDLEENSDITFDCATSVYTRYARRIGRPAREDE